MSRDLPDDLTGKPGAGKSSQHAPEFGTLAQRVPPEALEARANPDASVLEAAANVASGVHNPSKAPSEPERGAGQAERFNQESAALRTWARSEGLILPAGEFDREWKAAGANGGQEHDVYLSPDGRTILKRNNLSFHSSWQQYFERLVLHNWLFPEAPMAFRGFDESDGKLSPVISQPAIVADRGAMLAEVMPRLEKLGFVHIPGTEADFYNPQRGILVEDLHDENALVTGGEKVALIDPSIYASVPRNQVAKLTRLGLMDGDASAKLPSKVAPLELK